MDPIVRKKQLKAAHEQREMVIKKYRLRLEKVHRNGPRFYVAKCWLGHQPVIFKICLYARQIDPRTNNGMKREVITLNHFHAGRRRLFRLASPQVYYHNLIGRTWYIREYLSGEPQNVQESNFVFQEKFFSRNTADWINKFFLHLHRSSQLFPNKLKSVYARHTLETNMELIGWHKVPGYFNLPHIVERVKYFLYRRERLFDTHQKILTHYEPYASHFFKYDKYNFYIIDWENVDWGNPAHDISVIWNRAFLHPGWQKYLIHRFAQKTLYKKSFKDLFKVEALLQGISNIDYFRRTTHPAEKPIKQKAVKFYQNNIAKILTDKFNPY